MSKKNILEYILLLFIVAISLCLRLYKIDNPLADWHSWRQADTASVSRNFLKSGFDLMHPRFDDLSSLPSGRENPQGYRMVEFPVYNVVHAGLASIFPQKPLEWWGRMTSIIFSLLSLIILYLIVRKFIGVRVGMMTAFFFGTLPFSIYYSRAVLPEPMMIFASLFSIYLFSKWLDGGKLSFLYYLLSIVFAAMAFLIKPFAVFLLFPLVYLCWQKWHLGLFRRPLLYIFIILSVLPFGLWRVWISQYPEGIPNFTWLLNEANIRFKGAFFRWIFGERIGKLILGYWGLHLLVFGILIRPGNKEGWFFHYWLLGVLLYFTIVAGGNVHHDYYQILAIPAICIFLAKGGNFLLFQSSINFNRFLSSLLFVISCLFMLAFSWYELRDFYNVNHPEIVKAGSEADLLIPKSAKVIAPYSGDTAFLYQINRPGWPIINDEISADYLISRGATHYVAVNFDKQTQKLMETYKVLKQTDNFVIIDLTSPK